MRRNKMIMIYASQSSSNRTSRRTQDEQDYPPIWGQRPGGSGWAASYCITLAACDTLFLCAPSLAHFIYLSFSFPFSSLSPPRLKPLNKPSLCEVCLAVDGGRPSDNDYVLGPLKGTRLVPSLPWLFKGQITRLTKWNDDESKTENERQEDDEQKVTENEHQRLHRVSAELSRSAKASNYL